MKTVRLYESEADIKIARRNINNLVYTNDTTLTAKSKEELKSLLMMVKGESEKVNLKLNIKKLRSWHQVPLLHDLNRRGKSGSSDRFYFLGFQNHCRQ